MLFIYFGCPLYPVLPGLDSGGLVLSKHRGCAVGELLGYVLGGKAGGLLEVIGDIVHLWECFGSLVLIRRVGYDLGHVGLLLVHLLFVVWLEGWEVAQVIHWEVIAKIYYLSIYYVFIDMNRDNIHHVIMVIIMPIDNRF